MCFEALSALSSTGAVGLCKITNVNSHLIKEIFYTKQYLFWENQKVIAGLNFDYATLCTDYNKTQREIPTEHPQITVYFENCSRSPLT